MDFRMNFEVPMSSPDISEAERAAVNEVMRGNALSMGPFQLRFEAAIREFCGAKHTIDFFRC